MILTCPECASRYFVDDARIGTEGRRVRCASCGHAWREPAPVRAPEAAAPAESAFTLMPADPSALEAAEEPAKPRSRARADVSAKLREEASEKRKTREAAAVGAVWAGLGAGFCILALVAVVFKMDVVRMFPSTAGAYAFVHMPVNAAGLAIEAVQGKPGLENGRAALKVTGVERNVETHPRQPQPVRVILVDKADHHPASQLITPPPGEIQPGDTRSFTVSFLDPPMQAASAVVVFDFEAAGPKPAKAKAKPQAPAPAAPLPSAQMKLRGTTPAPTPPPVEAKEAAPLPANSPYALPQAAAHAHG